MPADSAVLYLLIVGCEVAFWLLLLLSLAIRYLFRREVLSRWLLLSLPLVDILLLVFTALDLRGGTTAAFAHGLAAAYVGFTIAFGSIAVNWADAHFSHSFAGGPQPRMAPSRGWEGVRFELKLWVRCILACAILVVLIDALVAIVANDTATEPLKAWYKYAFGCVIFWFIFGPAWNLLLVRRSAR